MSKKKRWCHPPRTGRDTRTFGPKITTEVRNPVSVRQALLDLRKAIDAVQDRPPDANAALYEQIDDQAHEWLDVLID